MDDALVVEDGDGVEELAREAADELLGQAGLGGRGQVLQRALRTKLHEDDHLVAVDLDAVVAHQVAVARALEDAQLVGHAAHRPVVVRLQADLLHRHQLARAVVHRREHAPETPLSCQAIAKSTSSSAPKKNKFDQFPVRQTLTFLVRLRVGLLWTPKGSTTLSCYATDTSSSTIVQR